MTRILGIVGAVLLTLSLCLGGLLNQAYKDNGKLKQKLVVMSEELKAKDIKAAKENEIAVANYESASEFCRASIKSAVAAVKIKQVEVPKYVKDGSVNPMCPVVSLRDVQAAGGGPFVSPSGNSNDPK
jgi:hypothetical protein